MECRGPLRAADTKIGGCLDALRFRLELRDQPTARSRLAWLTVFNARTGERPPRRQTGLLQLDTHCGRPLTKPTEGSAKFSPFDNRDSTVAVRNSHGSPAAPHQSRATALASAPFPSQRWGEGGRRPDEARPFPMSNLFGLEHLDALLARQRHLFCPSPKVPPRRLLCRGRHRPSSVPTPQKLVNGAGQLEFLFTAPDNAAFFRLESD